MSQNFKVGNCEVDHAAKKIFDILDNSMHDQVSTILSSQSEIQNKLLKFKLGKPLWLQCSIFNFENKVLIVGEDAYEVDNFHLLKKIESLGRIGGWVLDIASNFTYWTDETYKIYDIPIGTPIDSQMNIEFYHPDYRSKLTKCIENCKEKSEGFDEIFKFITTNKKEIWVRTTGSPVQDENGVVTKIMGTFQNIDSYVKLSEKLEEKTAQLNDILDNSPGMVYQFHLDNKGEMHFPYVSPKAFEIYEVQPRDFENDPSLMLKMAHESEGEDLHKKILESAANIEMFEWEGKIVTGSNAIKTIKARSIPRKNEDNSVTWNGIVMDITKEKELESELNDQKKLLECSARLASLGEISAGIGHEINTPLAIILLKMDEIRENLDSLGVQDPRLEKNFDYVDEAVNRINSIVKSLRHLSRDQDKNQKKTTNLCEEVERSMDLISELYRNNGIQITFVRPDKDLFVHCPGSHIQQIVLNLISNAKDVLLNRADPLIKIETEDDGDMAVLTVTDNGPGIPKDVQDKIFLPFFTTKDVDKGTGIGLAMCYSLIKNVNGSIGFETSGSGTKFKCRFLKVAQNKHDSLAQSMDEDVYGIVRNKKNPSILIIDDDTAFLEILNRELSKRLFNVCTANSGTVGLSLIKERKFDIILSDLRMPGMDGLSLFEEVKKNKLAANSLKVLMSGDVTDAYQERIEKARISTWLQKPFKIEKMIDVFFKKSA